MDAQVNKIERSHNHLAPFSVHLWMVYACAFLYIFRLAVMFIPLIQKLNYVSTGDTEETSAESSFNYFTIIFLKSTIEFLSVKYNSALSDHVGRKPVLVLSAAVFSIALLLFAAFSDRSIFFLAAMLTYLFQSGNIFIAWVCDLVSLHDRSECRFPPYLSHLT